MFVCSEKCSKQPNKVNHAGKNIYMYNKYMQANTCTHMNMQF